MRKYALLALLLMIVGCTARAVVVSTAVPPDVAMVGNPFSMQVASGSNLVLNPSWEDGFYNAGAGELDIGNNWAMGYDPNYGRRPECKPEQVGVGSGRVHSGTFAQKGFTTYSSNRYWYVQGLPAIKGQWYRFTFWAWVWSSSKDDPNKSEGTGKIWLKAGINPWGDCNAMSLATQWGTAVVDQYDKWIQLETYVQAQGDRIAVFVYTQAEFGAKHNDVYVDDAELVAVSAPGGDVTPYPTYTAYPTLVPLPTYTPQVCPTYEPSGECSIDDFIWIPVPK